jgi:hypothetical protein
MRTLLAALLIAGPSLAAAEEAAPVVYTNADLLRLFGAPTATPESPAPTRDSDAEWSLVDRVLQREQDRLEAERERERDRMRAEAAPPPEPLMVYPVAWRLGFPASVWWREVWCAYSGSEDTPGTPGLYPPCSSRDTLPVIVPGAAR